MVFFFWPFGKSLRLCVGVGALVFEFYAWSYWMCKIFSIFCEYREMKFFAVFWSAGKLDERSFWPFFGSRRSVWKIVCCDSRRFPSCKRYVKRPVPVNVSFSPGLCVHFVVMVPLFWGHRNSMLPTSCVGEISPYLEYSFVCKCRGFPSISRTRWWKFLLTQPIEVAIYQ